MPCKIILTKGGNGLIQVINEINGNLSSAFLQVAAQYMWPITNANGREWQFSSL